MKDKLLQKKKAILILLLVVLMFPITYALNKNGLLGFGRVSLASWNVTLNQTNENNSLAIVPDPDGTVASYNVNIVNTSEVSITYNIVIDNLPSGTSVALGSGGQYIPESNNKVTFSNVEVIPYNDQNKNRTHTLYFKAASNATLVSNREIDINVVVKQKV